MERNLDRNQMTFLILSYFTFMRCQNQVIIKLLNKTMSLKEGTKDEKALSKFFLRVDAEIAGLIVSRLLAHSCPESIIGTLDVREILISVYDESLRLARMSSLSDEDKEWCRSLFSDVSLLSDELVLCNYYKEDPTFYRRWINKAQKYCTNANGALTDEEWRMTMRDVYTKENYRKDRLNELIRSGKTFYGPMIPFSALLSDQAEAELDLNQSIERAIKSSRYLEPSAVLIIIVSCMNEEVRDIWGE